jgi:glycine cleavage system H protein
MTVLLVLATFIVLLTAEYLYSRRRGLKPSIAFAASVKPAPARLRPGVAAGFEVPDNLRYHPGHAWALNESPDLVRVGMDAFAARLVGKIEQISLPRRGQWIRQGQKIWTIQRNGERAEMLSPIEGIVASVNEAVLNDPGLALRDPYGEGWLVTVQAPDAKTSFRNLLGGGVAIRWMEEAAARLRTRTPLLAGAVAQDGGVAVADLGEHLPAASAWSEITREFFLT